MINEKNIEKFYGECCFCKNNIEITGTDPCTIVIVGCWDKKAGRREKIEFFYHSKCLSGRLYKSHTENSAHSSTSAIYTCCFCNESIQMVDDALYDIHRRDAWGISKITHFPLVHSFHLACLKERIHPFLRELFVPGIML